MDRATCTRKPVEASLAACPDQATLALITCCSPPERSTFAHRAGYSSSLMVPVCKSLGSLRLQIERGSGLLSSCPLQNSHQCGSLNRRRNSSLRQDTFCVKSSSVTGSEDSLPLSGSGGRMAKNQPKATVDINIAKAMLDYINASWTPYHAVGVT